MCWDNDYGDYTVLRQGKRTARKAHRCAEGCRINPGDVYHYWVGVYDGSLDEGKACQPCIDAANALGAACRLYEKWSDDPPLGGLSEAYSEHLDAGELPLDVVPKDVVRRLRRHYADLRKRLAA